MLTDFLARELAWLDRQAPLATSLRSRRGRILPAGLLAVLRIRIGGFVGIAVADTALPVHLAAPGLRAPTRDVLTKSASWNDLGSLATAVALECTQSLMRTIRNSFEPALRRERALDRERDRRAPSQPGLFEIARVAPGVPVANRFTAIDGADDLSAEPEVLLLAHIH
jgi:hypothetical protein